MWDLGVRLDLTTGLPAIRRADLPSPSGLPTEKDSSAVLDPQFVVTLWGTLFALPSVLSVGRGDDGAIRNGPLLRLRRRWVR